MEGGQLKDMNNSSDIVTVLRSIFQCTEKKNHVDVNLRSSSSCCTRISCNELQGELVFAIRTQTLVNEGVKGFLFPGVKWEAKLVGDTLSRCHLTRVPREQVTSDK